MEKQSSTQNRAGTMELCKEKRKMEAEGGRASEQHPDQSTPADIDYLNREI